MNLLANLSATYKQTLLLSGAAVEVSQNGNCSNSPYAEMIRTLQGLKQNDPTLYHRVKQEAVNTLQAANEAAEAAFDIRKLVEGRRVRALHPLTSQVSRLVNVLFPRVVDQVVVRRRD